MKSILLAFLLIAVLASPGCKDAEESAPPPAPDPPQETTQSQPQETGPQVLDCPAGGEKQTSFDLGANPHTERSSGAAVGVFLRQQQNPALQVTDFELVKQPGPSAEFVYTADSTELVSIFAERIDGGWAIVGYAACPGILKPHDQSKFPTDASKLIANRTDVVSVECSRQGRFIDEVLFEYPAVDFVARPTAACVAMLDDGSVLDLLRIRGDWTRIRRTGPTGE